MPDSHGIIHMGPATPPWRNKEINMVLQLLQPGSSLVLRWYLVCSLGPHNRIEEINDRVTWSITL